MDELTTEKPALKDLRGKVVTRESSRVALLGALTRLNDKRGWFADGAQLSKRDILREIEKLGVTIE